MFGRARGRSARPVAARRMVAERRILPLTLGWPREVIVPSINGTTSEEAIDRFHGRSDTEVSALLETTARQLRGECMVTSLGLALHCARRSLMDMADERPPASSVLTVLAAIVATAQPCKLLDETAVFEQLARQRTGRGW